MPLRTTTAHFHSTADSMPRFYGHRWLNHFEFIKIVQFHLNHFVGSWTLLKDSQNCFIFYFNLCFCFRFQQHFIQFTVIQITIFKYGIFFYLEPSCTTWRFSIFNTQKLIKATITPFGPCNRTF